MLLLNQTFTHIFGEVTGKEEDIQTNRILQNIFQDNTQNQKSSSSVNELYNVGKQLNDTSSVPSSAPSSSQAPSGVKSFEPTTSATCPGGILVGIVCGDPTCPTIPLWYAGYSFLLVVVSLIVAPFGPCITPIVVIGDGLLTALGISRLQPSLLEKVFDKDFLCN